MQCAQSEQNLVLFLFFFFFAVRLDEDYGEDGGVAEGDVGAGTMALCGAGGDLGTGGGDGVGGYGRRDEGSYWKWSEEDGLRGAKVGCCVGDWGKEVINKLGKTRLFVSKQ